MNIKLPQKCLRLYDPSTKLDPAADFGTLAIYLFTIMRFMPVVAPGGGGGASGGLAPK